MIHIKLIYCCFLFGTCQHSGRTRGFLCCPGVASVLDRPCVPWFTRVEFSQPYCLSSAWQLNIALYLWWAFEGEFSAPSHCQEASNCLGLGQLSATLLRNRGIFFSFYPSLETVGVHTFPEGQQCALPHLPLPASSICAEFLPFLQQWLPLSSRPAIFREALPGVLPCHPSFS